MPKSAERKRLGTYYTPRDFTERIVAQTVTQLAEERIEAIRAMHGLEEDQTASDEPSPALARYWSDCFESLRGLKICDPACGSGAFLIQAYDALEELYERIVGRLMLHDPAAAESLADAVPDIDSHRQPPRRGPLGAGGRNHAVGPLDPLRGANKTLATLSANIIQGNSLVSDPACIRRPSIGPRPSPMSSRARGIRALIA